MCPGFADVVYPCCSVVGISPLIHPLLSRSVSQPLTSSHAACNYIIEEKTGSYYLHSLYTQISQTGMKPLTSPERLHAIALLTTKCHAPFHIGLPLFCLSLSFVLIHSVFPFLLSHTHSIPLQRCTADVSRQEALYTSECHK